jgi:hypothetical protein
LSRLMGELIQEERRKRIVNNIYNMKPYFILAFIIVCGFSCERFGESKYPLNIINGSNHTIAYYVAAGGIEHKYPDTALISDKFEMGTIPSGASDSWHSSVPFDRLFQLLPTDTLSIYLFHPDTLAKYDWNVIRSEYKVLKRFDVSLDDLKRNHYKVTYR